MEAAFFERIIYMAFGIFFGVLLKSYLDRKLFLSNKIFELRLDILNNVWLKFVEVKKVVTNSEVDKSRIILEDFRKEADKARFVLDYQVIDNFFDLYDIYSNRVDLIEERVDNNKKSKDDKISIFENKVKEILNNLTEKINKSLYRNKYKIKLGLHKSI